MDLSGGKSSQVCNRKRATHMAITPSRAGLLNAAIVFAFFPVVMNIQAHGWLALYRLSVSGQKTEAIVTRRQPEIHQTCYFEYTVNSLKYEGSEGGCHSEVGQAVEVTYLPSEPSFVTLKSPKGEFTFQVFAAAFMSAFAGIVGAWRERRRSRKELKPKATEC